jgi:hypothetical protein
MLLRSDISRKSFHLTGFSRDAFITVDRLIIHTFHYKLEY